jgi:vacuolar-type H+-ATPase subunit H
MSSNYTQTLKTIKEKEEEINNDLDSKKKELEATIHKLQEEAFQTLASARLQAEKKIADQVGKTRAVAEKEADELAESKKKEANQVVSRTLTDSEIQQIIDDILLSEFNQT